MKSAIACRLIYCNGKPCAGQNRWVGETYDLWGIPDEPEEVLENQFETRVDGLWKVYRFKRGFGGQIRRTAGGWDKVFKPALYNAYQFATSKSSEAG